MKRDHAETATVMRGGESGECGFPPYMAIMSRRAKVGDLPEPTSAAAWLMEAQRYLIAANVLRESDAYEINSTLLTPTLHLLAHGIELALKGFLAAAGVPYPEVRKFGHELWTMWTDPRLEEARLVVLRAAYASAQVIGGSQKPLPRSMEQKINSVVPEFIKAISDLHSKESDFALRYQAGRSSGMPAPRPQLLIDAFGVAVHHILVPLLPPD